MSSSAPAPAAGPPGGARGLSKEELRARAARLLAAEGLDPAALEVSGADWRFIYEVSKAAGYDDQLIVVWGAIFGVLGWHAEESVTIVNTLAGEAIVRVRARAEDIRELARGIIDDPTFLSRLEITSLGPAAAAPAPARAARPGGLAGARASLEAGFVELPAVVQGDLRQTLAVPTRSGPLYKPLPVRFWVDRGGSPLSVDDASFDVVLEQSRTSVGTVQGRTRALDGRVEAELPPRPFAAAYLIHASYRLPDGSRATSVHRYDAR